MSDISSTALASNLIYHYGAMNDLKICKDLFFDFSNMSDHK